MAKKVAKSVAKQAGVCKRPAANVCKRPAAAAAVPIPPCELPLLADAGETAMPDWYGEANAEQQNQVFLVTAAKLVNEADEVRAVEDQKPPPLRDPACITKEEFREALQDSIQNPMYDHKRGGRPPSRTLELDLYVGVKEGSAGEQHHHAALKLHAAKHRFLPFKLAMRWRHGIATHWSTTHSQTWSAVRYLHCTTPHKKNVDRRPELWTRDGRKLNLHEESQEPFVAVAWNKKRESITSDPFAKKPKKDSFNKLDFSALVLEHRLLTPNAVLEYMQEKGSKAMQLWTHCRQRKLKEFIKDALDMEAAKKSAALERETPWALIERLSKGTCSCGEDGCFWWSLALDFFKDNPQIDRRRLAATLRKVICMGPCKEARVPLIIGKPNCAKSTVLDPILKVFGEERVVGKPKLGASNGALSKLSKEDAVFLYWDDNRPVDYASLPKDNPTVPVLDFLALFSGQTLDVQVSQSFNDGHPRVQWKKGAAMTAKEEGLWDLKGDVTGEDVRHMKARVEIFRATHVVGTDPDDFHTSPKCPEAWCRWIVVDSIAYANRPAPRNFPGGAQSRQPSQRKRLPALGSAPPSTRPTTRSTGSLTAAQKKTISEKRQAAVRRKLEKQRLASGDDDEDDPFGFGGGIDQ